MPKCLDKEPGNDDSQILTCYGLTSHYRQGKENIVHLQRLDNYPSDLLSLWKSDNDTAYDSFQ